MDLDYFTKKLESEEVRIKAEMEFNESEDPFKDKNRSTEVLDDAITEIEEHDRIQALLASLERELTEVKKAQLRLKDGTFGICSNCHNKIDEERLKIMPTALLCASCQASKKRA